MNSSLYICNVMHYRLSPVKHRFNYNIFMFCLDLDEINVYSKTLWFFSRNRFNLYAFRDKDHMQLGGNTVKENIMIYLDEQGVESEIGKVLLLTNVSTLGYNFNPVSFYFCFDKKGKPVCAVPEVGNTFGELKPFFLGKNNLDKNVFISRKGKYFYVSPFIELDSSFEFKLGIPGEKLNISIDDYRNQERIFLSKLTGERKVFNDYNLFLYALRFPFITLKIIGAIHWQAMRLYMKKIPYNKKNDNLELQRGALKNAGTYNR